LFPSHSLLLLSSPLFLSFSSSLLAEREWEWGRGEGAAGGDVCEGCMTCGPKRVERMTTKQIAWDRYQCVLLDGPPALADTPPGLATIMYRWTLRQCTSWLKLFYAYEMP
jgi:hypothetical protein